MQSEARVRTAGTAGAQGRGANSHVVGEIGFSPVRTHTVPLPMTHAGDMRQGGVYQVPPLSVCLSLCLSGRLFICQSIYVSIYHDQRPRLVENGPCICCPIYDYLTISL